MLLLLVIVCSDLKFTLVWGVSWLPSSEKDEDESNDDKNYNTDDEKNQPSVSKKI